MRVRALLLALWLIIPVAQADDNASYRAIYQVHPSVTGFDTEFSAVLPFYEDTLAEVRKLDQAFPRDAPTDRQIFGIDTFDLNKDETKEIFVWIGDRAICGANVCPLDIYEKDANGRLRVIGGGTVHGGPLILASATHGYYDLAYFWWGYGETFYLIWRFNGAQYQFFTRVAVDRVQNVPKE